MIRLVGKKLIIPRGDTGSFSVPLVTTFDPSDKAIFSILDGKTQKVIQRIECTINEEALTVNFTHYDTVNLPIGKYYWDIKSYKNPEIVDRELVNGTEVDSYYAAYSLPVCEIRQTGDKLLNAEDDEPSILNQQDFNLLNAALNEAREANTALQQYKGEIEDMLHQEQRLETVETTLQNLMTSLQSLRNELQQHISEVNDMFNQEERLETIQNTISSINNEIQSINNLIDGIDHLKNIINIEEESSSENFDQTVYPDSMTRQGITFTKNSDNSIILSGTNTSNYDFYWQGASAGEPQDRWLLHAGTYELSGGFTNIPIQILLYNIHNKEGINADIIYSTELEPLEFTLQQGHWAFIRWMIKSEIDSAEGITLHPLLKLVGYKSTTINNIKNNLDTLNSTIYLSTMELHETYTSGLNKNILNIDNCDGITLTRYHSEEPIGERSKSVSLTIQELKDLLSMLQYYQSITPFTAEEIAQIRNNLTN